MRQASFKQSMDTDDGGIGREKLTHRFGNDNPY